jgi:hypothetical protein
VPRQDAQGRWISDDGLQYWDGAAWRPTGSVGAPRRVSAFPAVLIGCGFALVIVLVLGIGTAVLFANNADIQRSFCNGWSSGNNSQNLACPFHPSP